MIEQKLKELGLAPLYGEYCPLTERDIHEIERITGFTLPEEYKRFASKFGCGHFTDTRVAVRAVEPPPPDLSNTNWLDIAVFLGSGERYRLLDKLKLARGRMPATVIPIADDYGGNLFCLGVGGDDRDKVYIWDFHNEPDPQDYIDAGLPVPDRLMYSNMGLVARSFTDFILQMAVQDDEG